MNDVSGVMSSDSDYPYWAFICATRRDENWALWLRKAIETTAIPGQLVGYPVRDGLQAPRFLKPLFWHKDDLASSSNLMTSILAAIDASRYLIVICSPHAAKSPWVNAEVEHFVRTGRQDRILAVVVDGEPNSGGEAECFPPALRALDQIAVDVRDGGDSKNAALIKLQAAMLGVPYDVLYQRDSRRRIAQLRRRLVAAIVWMSALAISVWFRTDVAWILASLAGIAVIVVIVSYLVFNIYFYVQHKYLRIPFTGRAPVATSASSEKQATEPPSVSTSESDFVFITYKREDLERIIPLLHKVVSWGFPIWYDKGIPGGAEWDALIEEKVSRCRVLLAFLSPEAVESKWVRREIKFADHENKPVLGIRLERELKLKHGLAIVMNQYQMIDASDSDFSNELRRAIEYVRLL